MILDTSAVIAVLNDEPERATFEQLIASDECAMSSMSYLESSIVMLHRRGAEALTSLDIWIESAAVEIVPLTAAHVRLARSAYARYGKGRHKAGLNFGDCAAYALAVERDDGLLFRGNDFSHTDVLAVSAGVDE